MYNVAVVCLLGIVLIGYSGVFVVKNFLVSYKASDNGYKNVAVIALVVIAVILAAGAAADAWGVEGLQSQLQDGNIGNPEVRALVERDIAYYKRESIICIVFGYLLFAAACFVYKNIEKEVQKRLENQKNRWDWSKIGR